MCNIRLLNDEYSMDYKSKYRRILTQDCEQFNSAH